MINLADLYCTDPQKACTFALARTAHMRNFAGSQRIERINTLLGLHGTEAVYGQWQNGYWCDVVAVYANTGDSYALTVIHVRGDDHANTRFIISSIGDFVERNEKRYGIK